MSRPVDVGDWGDGGYSPAELDDLRREAHADQLDELDPEELADYLAARSRRAARKTSRDKTRAAIRRTRAPEPDEPDF